MIKWHAAYIVHHLNWYLKWNSKIGEGKVVLECIAIKTMFETGNVLYLNI